MYKRSIFFYEKKYLSGIVLFTNGKVLRAFLSHSTDFDGHRSEIPDDTSSFQDIKKAVTGDIVAVFNKASLPKIES